MPRPVSKQWISTYFRFDCGHLQWLPGRGDDVHVTHANPYPIWCEPASGVKIIYLYVCQALLFGIYSQNRLALVLLLLLQVETETQFPFPLPSFWLLPIDGTLVQFPLSKPRLYEVLEGWAFLF